VIAAVNLLGVRAFSARIVEEGWVLVAVSLQIAQVAAWVWAAGLVFLAGYGWAGGTERILGWLKVTAGRLSRLGWLLLPLMALLLLAFPAVLMSGLGVFLEMDWTRHAFFLWLVIALTLCLVAYRKRPWPQMALLAALGIAIPYHLATFIPHVNNYPFSLWWSETTRYYLASTFFDQRIYGQDLPVVFRDFTRYLIQAAPFMVPDSPLWVHRLWQAALRFLMPYLTGYLLARRLELKGAGLVGIFTAWAGLYFFQGPVFYNLIVVVMLVFLFVDAKKFWRTLLAVVLVSAYAGLSRINWVPMAGLMAAIYYFLAVPVSGRRAGAVVRYLLPPAVWVTAGLAAGFAAQQLWAITSGNPPEIYFSSFTSYLLWKRLFPNPSYALGILPAILLVSAPMWLYLLRALQGWRTRWHPIRVLAVAAILAMMFAGGLLVSIKIGGGTNLHNLDGFLVLLLIVVVELYFGRVMDEHAQPVSTPMPVWLRTAALAMPIVFIITFTGLAAGQTSPAATTADLARLQKYADQAVAEGGEVLFISQRHLLTFGLIEDVPLVHDHEKLILQEMVMSRNQAYLDSFAREMASQRYALIFTDRLPSDWKNPEKSPLAMENNVVWRHLTPLINCAYQVEDLMINQSLEVYIPRDEPVCDIEE
jgi:hypothetical protein